MNQPYQAPALLKQLQQGLQAMEIDMAEAVQKQLLYFALLLAKWSQAYNLTTVREVEQIIPTHILDSLTLLPHLTEVDSVLDVGTGAGLPGLPLAIARPEIAFQLVDSQQKKINFIQHVITSLRLSNVTATQQRIEALKVSSPVDVVVSRAFASLEEFVKLIANVCDNRTNIIAMKGRRELVLQEAQALPNNFELVNIEAVDVPGINAERCLVFLRKR